MAINKVLVTHDSNFHTDDVFAVATLRLIHGQHLVVKRTRDVEAIELADIVLDVGGIYEPDKDRFDHHQPGGAGERRSGVPYASVGLVWKKYGPQLCANNIDISDIVDRKLIAPIDAWDNGVSIATPHQEGVQPFTISMVVIAMNPTWREEAEYVTPFYKAVAFAEDVLRREIAHASATVAAKTSVLGAYDRSGDKRILMLQEAYPWFDAVKDMPEVLFVIAPRRSDGTWSAKVVSKDGEFEGRTHFPEEWAGKEGAAMQVASGVDDALFCHRTCLMAYAKSQAGAISLVRKALDTTRK